MPRIVSPPITSRDIKFHSDQAMPTIISNIAYVRPEGPLSSITDIGLSTKTRTPASIWKGQRAVYPGDVWGCLWQFPSGENDLEILLLQSIGHQIDEKANKLNRAFLSEPLAMLIVTLIPIDDTFC